MADGNPFAQAANDQDARTEEASPIDVARETLRLAIGKSPLDADKAIEQCHEMGLPKGALRQEFKLLQKESSSAEDTGYRIARTCFELDYANGEHIMFLHDKSFWSFNGKCWVRRKLHSIQSEVVARMEQMELTEDDIGSNSFEGLKKAATSLLGSLVTRDDDPLEFMNPPAPVLCLANGQLDLTLEPHERTLEPHNPKSYLRLALDVEYDPEARAPVFTKALMQICKNDARLGSHLIEQMGYSLSPNKPFAAFLLWVGEGSNGKTTLGWVLEQLAGATCRSQDIGSLFVNQFSRNALVGSSIIMDDDYDDKGGKIPFPIAGVKKISERKRLTGEIKGGETYDFTAATTPVILANDWPFANDASYAFFRRANVVKFEQRFSLPRDVERDATALNMSVSEAVESGEIIVADDGVKTRMLAEMPGILNLLIQGRDRTIKRKGFEDLPKCRQAQSDWLERSNSVLYFVKMRCKKSTSDTPLSTFKANYRDFCNEEGIRARNERKISEDLRRAGYVVTKTGPTTFVRGTVVGSELDPEAEAAV